MYRPIKRGMDTYGDPYQVIESKGRPALFRQNAVSLISQSGLPSPSTSCEDRWRFSHTDQSGGGGSHGHAPEWFMPSSPTYTILLM